MSKLKNTPMATRSASVNIFSLPPEILHQIFGYLAWQDHFSLGSVCTIWARFLQTSPFYQQRYIRRSLQLNQSGVRLSLYQSTTRTNDNGDASREGSAEVPLADIKFLRVLYDGKLRIRVHKDGIITHLARITPYLKYPGEMREFAITNSPILHLDPPMIASGELPKQNNTLTIKFLVSEREFIEMGNKNFFLTIPAMEISIMDEQLSIGKLLEKIGRHLLEKLQKEKYIEEITVYFKTYDPFKGLIKMGYIFAETL